MLLALVAEHGGLHAASEHMVLLDLPQPNKYQVDYTEGEHLGLLRAQRKEEPVVVALGVDVVLEHEVVGTRLAPILHVASGTRNTANKFPHSNLESNCPLSWSSSSLPSDRSSRFRIRIVGDSARKSRLTK